MRELLTRNDSPEPRRPAMPWARVARRIGNRAWLAAYDLEEAREGHAAGGRYLRSAGCCIALAILRLMARRGGAAR